MKDKLEKLAKISSETRCGSFQIGFIRNTGEWTIRFVNTKGLKKVVNKDPEAAIDEAINILQTQRKKIEKQPIFTL